MKEAAGEANMTVITIVLIGVVAAVGLMLVPRLMRNATIKACCTDYGWMVKGSRCCDPNGDCNTAGNYLGFGLLRDKETLSTKTGQVSKALYECIYGE